MPGIPSEQKIYTGLKALPIRLKFWLSLLKYLPRRKQHPRFFLNPLKRGFLKTIRLRKKIGLNKIVKFNGDYFLSLRLPRWPSKPFDFMAGNGGLNFAAAGTALKPHIDYVILAVTRKCRYRCRHCYEQENISENETVPVGRWREVIADLQKIGVSIINLSGGEPMLRFDGILELLRTGDHERSEFHLHTSGHGVTEEKAGALRKAGLTAAAVGLDDVDPERHDALRGYDGAFGEAVQALRIFHEAGLFTYTNMCPTPEFIRSGGLWEYLQLTRKMGAASVQILEPRPCGGYLKDSKDQLLTEGDRSILTEFFKQGNGSPRYKNHPYITYISYVEAPERMGCLMGGLSHFHIDGRGNVTPCVFLPVSFGNIMAEDFSAIYKRMRRAVPGPLHRECPSLFLSDIIRKNNEAGSQLPLPFDRIEGEWRSMYESADSASTKG